MTKKQTPRNDGARKSFESGSTVNYSIDGATPEQSNKLKAALFYARVMGWYVFPCGPKSKEPLKSLKKGGFRLATTDEEQIRQWWAQHPDANIGWWPHPSGHAVIDIDHKNGGKGFISLEALEAKHGDLPNTLTAITPSGAQHRVFKCQEALPSRHVADGIDMRCANGYVLLEPSVFEPASGKSGIAGNYYWNDWVIGSDELPEIAELPQWVIDEQAKNTKETASDIDKEQPIEYIEPSDPQEVMARFEALKGTHRGLRNRWNGSTDGLNDTSGSALDMSIAKTLAHNGFTYSEARYLLKDYPHGGTDRNEPRYWWRIWHEVSRGITPKRSLCEIRADAENLTPDSDAGAITALVQETAALTAIERRQVWQVMKNKTKLPFSVFTQAMTESAEREEVDHLDLAREVIDEKGADNVIQAEAHTWEWDNKGVWVKREDRAVKQWVQNVVAGKEQVTKGLVDSVSDLLKTEIYKPSHQFDVGHPETVNTLSGEVELIRGSDGKYQPVLQPHNKTNYRTTQIPVEYDPNATAPRFEQFLREVFPNSANGAEAKAVLEMMGYSLMAHCRHEKFIILVGNGANGKSVLLSTLEALCGSENVAGVQPSQFANKFQRAHLHGKLANIVTEIEQGEVIDDAALKGIVSGEPTTVEHKFRDPFQMRPFSTCWFGTNHMPHTRDFSDALFRRALIIRFEAVFKPELGNCDPHLGETLKSELPGILNMALKAYAGALDAAGQFTMPESSRLALEEWRLEADQVQQFIEELYIESPASEVPASTLYKDYKYWAENNGIQRALSMKSFRDRVTRLGFGYRRTSQARLVTGLRAKFPHEGGSDRGNPAFSHGGEAYLNP